ncbi:MAG: hypothetical protein ACRD5I_00125, partial [Candidatus Acidiferrales bacterium]
AKALETYGVLSEIGTSDHPFDFIATVDGRKVVIETKLGGKNMSLPLVQRWIRLLHHAIELTNADEAILVTKEPVDFPKELIRDTRVSIMPLKQLRNYLAHRAE